MSDTPKAADDVMKLLDANWNVTIFKNWRGSYTAYAWKGKKQPRTPYGLPECQVTDAILLTAANRMKLEAEAATLGVQLVVEVVCEGQEHLTAEIYDAEGAGDV